MVNALLSRKNYAVPLLLFTLALFSFVTANPSQGALMPVYEKLQPFISSGIGAIDVATDQIGHLYVADTADNSVTIFDADGRRTAKLSGIPHPLCIEVASDGKLYVGNKDNADVDVYSADLTFQYKLGRNNVAHEFRRPNDLTISSSGQIYVVDWGAEVVNIYNPDGTFSSSFGSPGNGEAEFHRPLAIAINETVAEVIVLDQKITSSHGKWIDGARIQVFDLHGVFKREIILYGKYVGNLFRPQRVTIDDQGRWYVTDAYHNVIFVYDGRDGSFLGTIYDLQNPLRTPMGITHDGNRLYVAARGSEKVEMYSIDQILQTDQNSSMKLSPSTFTFQGQELGSNPVARSITLENGKPISLNWSAVINDPWMTLTSTSGTLSGNGTVSPALEIDLSGLAPGTYIGSIDFNAEMLTATINVELIVTAAPQLSVTPSTLTFTAIDGGVTQQGLSGDQLQPSNSESNATKFPWVLFEHLLWPTR